MEDAVAGPVIAGQFYRKPASHAPAVDEDVVFRVLFQLLVVHELRIFQQLRFRPFARTLPETPVIDHEHVVAMPGIVAGVFPPTFDTPRVAMKIQQQPPGFRHLEVKAVEPYARFRVKEQLFEGLVVMEGEIRAQLLRLPDEAVLDDEGQQDEYDVTGKDVVNHTGPGYWVKTGQSSTSGTISRP